MAILSPVLVGVIGLGYLGLTHAVAMASLGHQVIGIESSRERLDDLKSGKVPFFEPGLAEALSAVTSKRNLTFASAPDEADICDLYFLCVGTPQGQETFAIDTEAVFQAGSELAKVIKSSTVVVGKSTVPLGTADRLVHLMSAEAGFDVNLAWNPEFLREGTALEDSLNPDRVVIGAWNDFASNRLKEVYKPILDSGVPLCEVSIATAELVKVAANAFLATKVSFINAMAEIAEASGADASDLANALGYDERIGNKFLRSGIGFGGGCLPKDLRGFISRAADLGVGDAVNFLKDIDAINQRRRARVFTLAKEELGDLRDKKVLILGISFKPDSDDLRDSPALNIALRLAEAGAKVTTHDPVALSALGDKHPELIREQDLSAAAKDQELVILGTEWSEYKAIDPTAFGDLVANKLIIDGRNVLDVTSWQAAGWRLIALGRNVHN